MRVHALGLQTHAGQVGGSALLLAALVAPHRRMPQSGGAGCAAAACRQPSDTGGGAPAGVVPPPTTVPVPSRSCPRTGAPRFRRRAPRSRSSRRSTRRTASRASPTATAAATAASRDRGYDCSGLGQLRAARRRPPRQRRSTPRPFMRWGEPGRGQWITVYTNPGHALRRDRRPALRHVRPRRARPALARRARSSRGFTRPAPARASSSPAT